jgi:hypothetical protein
MPMAVAKTRTAAIDATTKATLVLIRFIYTSAVELVPTRILPLEDKRSPVDSNFDVGRAV